MNIGAQSVHSASPTTVAVKQVRPTGEDVARTTSGQQSDTQSDTPSPDKVLYPKHPAQGDTMGSLSIPALKQKLPIIEGTGTDDLKKGVGHFTHSALPGEKDNCVLSGHRDTVFARLGELKIGDRLIVQTSAGTYTYQIKRIRIVHKDDRTVIVPTDHAVLTVSTCYPFHYIGSAPDRYVLSADLVGRQ
jgi:sortase A